VGVGPDGERLRRLIEQLHAPVSLEERPVPHAEMPSLLAAHDYFIAPDRKIPAQGVAMCEAMACGLPVVAVGAGGVPEFVVDGADGFLFRRYDVGALRRALLDLVADPEHARAMGRSARARVSERCSAERVIAAELELIARVTARARG
jgi:glycosyltransferase involved in cell wall biosynthesis